MISLSSVADSSATINWTAGGTGNDFVYLNVLQGSGISGTGNLTTSDSVDLNNPYIVDFSQIYIPQYSAEP